MPESRAGSSRRPDGALANQARVLRSNLVGTLRSRLDYNGVQKVVVTLLLTFSVSTATLLLLSETNRQRLLSRASIEWSRLYQSEESQGIFELPPPPPRRFEPQIVFRTPVPVAEPEGTFYTAKLDDAGFEMIEEIFVAPQVTPGFEAAFKLLTSESEAASKLFKGELPNLRYEEWKPLQNKHPEYYVSMLATQIESQTEVQFVWSVNTETSRIIPLSQAARDLERIP